jgi:phosphatidate cytidylyltransferase
MSSDAGQEPPGLPPSPPDIPEPEGPLDPVPVVQPPPPERRGRAGRNLPIAIGVGVVLAGLVLASLYVDKRAFVVFACLAVGLGAYELSNALGSSGIRVPVVPVLIGSVAMLVAAYDGGADPLVAALALSGLAVFVWRMTDGSSGYVRDVSAGITALFYVAFLAGFAMLLLRPDDGPDRVVVFVLLVVASDTGGFAAGVLFGKHPMAPTISPKKSWEGFCGSAAGSVLAGAIAVPAMLGGEWWEGAVLGAAAVCTATLGDLGESMVKRDLGIKDMGSLLPGHGGVMDRLDSLLPTAPIAWLLLSAFVPTS